MSLNWRSMIAGAKDVAPLILGVIPFGLVTGAAVVEAGFGVGEALGMAALVNAGASQLAATTLVSEKAPLLVAIGTALVINARMIIYSSSLAPVVAEKAGRLRPLISHMLIDQSYATTMTRGRFREDLNVVAYFAGSWVSLALVWQISNVIGAVAGSFVPPELALDFSIPLVFLAMLVPTLKAPREVEVAVIAAVAAALLVPRLPMQTGVLASIVIGMLWGAARDRRIPAESNEPTADRAEGGVSK